MRGRLQVLVIVLTGVFLAGMILIFAVFTMSPDIAALNRPILLTAFIVALFLSLVCIAWLLRWLLRPYTQLIGEAKRAPVEHSGTTQNEAEFVLETFQSVLAQLQAQRKESERLTAEASQRADSAEKFSERIVASMPTGLVAFDTSGHATVINSPAGTLLETNTIGDHFRNVFQKAPDLARLVDDCLTTGKLFRREEINAVNGLGHPKRLGATVAPIDPATPGTARGVLCLLTDITEVTRLREQVALKRNLESLGEMSAGLAHEFKNAIAALHGYAQFLQSVDHDERGRTAASGLLQEVRNLSDRKCLPGWRTNSRTPSPPSTAMRNSCKASIMMSADGPRLPASCRKFAIFQIGNVCRAGARIQERHRRPPRLCAIPAKRRS